MDSRYDNPADADQLDNAPDELEQLFEDVEEPQAPRLVRIRLNGQTLEVTEDVAAAIEAHDAEQKRVIGRQGQELGELRKRPAQDSRPVIQEPAQDDDLEFFASPSKAMARRIQEAEERAYQRIREDNQREQAQQKFWGSFYTANADLKDHEDVVQFLVQKHYDDLKDLSPAECHRELAAKANAFLGRSPAPGKSLPNRPAQSERPAQPAPSAPRQAQVEPKQAMSLSQQLVEERRERRRKAKFNIKD